MSADVVADILAAIAPREAPILSLFNRYRAPEYLALWRQDVQLHQHFAKRLLDQGNPGPALELIREGLGKDHHPGDPDLLYLEALALSRGGNVERTQHAVAALLRRGDLPLRLCVEALSLAGRTWKDRYERARDPAAQTEWARRSAEQYEQAFNLTEDPFPGVNAATMARLAGDAERGRRLAERARDQARRQSDDADYWLQASLGEAHLLLGETATAAEHYGRAVALAGKDHGSIARMRQQLLMLRRVLPETEALLGLFRLGAIVAFAGHRIDAPEEVAAGRVRFPPSAVLEQTVRAAISAALQRLNAVVGYCAPSCGADLLFAETLLERGGELHVVLPFDREDFLRTRVHYNQEAMQIWTERCQCVLERAEVHFAIQEEFLDDHSLFDFADVFMQGLALARARQVGAEAQALLLLDSAGSQDSGTARFQEQWHTASRSQPHVLDLAALRAQAGVSLPPPSAAPAPLPRPRKREVRAMLFADVKNYSKLPDRKAPEFFLAFLRQVQRVIEHAAVPPLFSNTWGDGIFMVTPDVRSCADIALRLLDELEQLNWEELGLPRETGVRLGLHTGPVFKGADPVIGRENFFGSHVSRAARIEPVTVPGCAFASEQFAACLTVEAATEFACEYLGVHELPKDYGRCPLYRVLRR